MLSENTKTYKPILREHINANVTHGMHYAGVCQCGQLCMTLFSLLKANEGGLNDSGCMSNINLISVKTCGTERDFKDKSVNFNELLYRW